MQRVYPVFRRSFASIKDSKVYQTVKEFLTIHETYVQHTRYAPEGSTSPGFRYPAPSSQKIPVIPTTEDTDRYFKTDLVQHDTRYLEPEMHVVLSEQMRSLPKDIQDAFIIQHSCTASSCEIVEHPVVQGKPTDCDNWTTETNDKVDAKLYENYPDQLPHPVFWENDAGKIVEDYESKGLPPCPGKMYQWESPKEAEDGLW